MTGRVLRVGIDGRAFASPAAGVRRYVYELTRAIVASNPDGIALVAIGAPGDVVLPDGIQRAVEGLSAPTNFGRHVTALPLAIARARVDLFHAPAYTAPLWGSTPVVLSVHDVSYARHPEWYPYRRDPARRWFYRQSARRARLIVTISEFSKREIIAAYGVPADRIVVTPLGVSEMFRPLAATGATAGVRAAAGMPGAAGVPAAAGAAATTTAASAVREQAPFLLHVGDLHVRRNLGIVVRALARLRDLRVKLVIAGADRGVGEALLREALAVGVREAVDFRGRVSDAELVALYQRCAALVYPSRYEGFGFPLVEAMACGAPVIASNVGAVAEVAGRAAVLLDPDDEPGFAEAIQRVVSDPTYAAALRERGLTRAAQFSWSNTAARTIEAYRGAARLTDLA
jgi:glycosyltransferase involved in cell wall biosynthesis